MPIKLFNTLGRKLQDFIPLQEGKVKLYACGPTVYNYAHLGNLRTYINVDLLRRSLEYFGYEVVHVMNITDVGHLASDADEGEDKIISAAQKSGKSPWEIAAFYKDAFFKDTDRLNILRPKIVCKATDHIDDMIELIKKIEKNGYTYQTGGNLYFDISKFPDYGKLALLELEDLKAGLRVEIDQNKKNPHDFVLWFTRSKFDHQAMLWDSPWGRGYPGWHIECSAMSMCYLGDQFDIHCGGIDHIPVHHTNEIAQSQAATGKQPVNYWIHAEFLVLEKEKMSKAKGNFLTLDSIVEDGFHPLDYRYFCLLAHYRTQARFSYEALTSAKNSRANLNEKILALKEAGAQDIDVCLACNSKAKPYLDSFADHLANDINIPQALSDLWDLLREKDLTAQDKLAAAYKMDTVLGLGLKSLSLPTESLEAELLALIEEREKARQAKDYKRADEIRKILTERGVFLSDTEAGVKWRKKL